MIKGFSRRAMLRGAGVALALPWLETLAPDSREQVTKGIARLIKEESEHGMEFVLTVKATLVMGQKALNQ